MTPEPWAMPGYADPVIMAAGTFTMGASLELSADVPFGSVFGMAAGWTYLSSGKLGILLAAQEMEKDQ